MIQDKLPLVSIIMNSYNSEAFLSEAINSVISQKYENWEIIFWDNASTDNSPKIVKNFNDSRIKYFRSLQTDRIYLARNLAIEKCSGQYTCFLDCDDIWLANSIIDRINAFNQETRIVYGGFEIIDEKGNKSGKVVNPKKAFNTFDQLLFRNTISIGAVMIETKLLKKYLFDSNYHLMGDFELWFRLSLSHKFKNLNKIVELSRRHPKNISSVSKSSLWISERRRFYRNFFKHSSIIKHPEIIFYILFSEIQALIFKK